MQELADGMVCTCADFAAWLAGCKGAGSILEWLDAPVPEGQFQVAAISGSEIRVCCVEIAKIEIAKPN